MLITLYASYYITKRGKKCYDCSTMAYLKKNVRWNVLQQIKNMDAQVITRIMKDLKIEKVLVDINPYLHE